MTVKFIIDFREKYVRELLNEKCNFLCENLLLGDFSFTDDSYHLLLERKTWNDLHSSIKDGRFREQRSRLLEWKDENKKFMYILEGPCPKEMEKEYTTTLRLMVGYNIPVYYTNSLEDTVHLLQKMSMMENLEIIFRSRSIEQDQIESRKCGKKKNYTDAKLFMMETFMQIHGLTFEMVQKITESYHSLFDIFANYTVFEENLSNIEYKTKQGKNRKLTKKMIEKIIGNLRQ